MQVESSTIPFGYCHCGCGEKTTIAKDGRTKTGYVKGQPIPFIKGHALRLRIYTRIPIEDRFWAKVDKNGPNGCWVWTASKNNAGYGQLGAGGAGEGLLFAHRVSWEIANGEIPEGLWVLHNCPGGDNPACCNPAHLFLGTPGINSQDAVQKGRWAHGETHPLTSLTADDVRAIRLERAAGVKGRELAKRYGVTPSAISNIFTRKVWTHID